MARRALLDRLDALEQSLREMGELAERAVAVAVAELLSDETLAPAGGRIRARDIRASSAALSEQCLEVIATQQPVAADLRLVMAIQSVVVDLERIAAHARSIARLLRRMRRESPEVPLAPALGELARQIQDAFHATLLVFLTHDGDAARATMAADSRIDAEYTHLVHDILGQMVAKPETLAAGLAQLDVAHKLERMGDRMSNIAERTIWVSSGTLPHHDSDML
ncbi:MAG: phosphate signaling complex protein PhoU [Chloroflexota bacterium]